MLRKTVLAVAVAVIAAPAMGAPWFTDTIETTSPAVRWDSGTYKYMANTTVHGDGTLAPLNGGYKVVTSPGDQLYYHGTSGSHFTGTANGLWTTAVGYTLLADPTNSKTAMERAQFDIKFSTIGSGINYYIGNMKPYASLNGTTSDMYAYALVRFTAGSPGKANARLFGTTFNDVIDVDWSNKTYQVIADVDVANDTAVLSVTDGTNVLATETGSMSFQFGASTTNALNGWMMQSYAGAAFGQDNFVFETQSAPGIGIWHRETYEPPDYPTFGGSAGNSLHDCGETTHKRWVRASGQGYRHSSGQSTMGPGGAGGIWAGGGTQHTLVADDTKSHDYLERMSIDVRVSTVGGDVVYYVGEMRTSGTNGTTSDLDSYTYAALKSDGAGGFKVTTTAGDVATGLELWNHAAGGEAWYQVVWDFDVDGDTCTVSVIDDVSGVLGSLSAPVVNQNTPTFEAVNGLNAIVYSGAGLVWDNLTFETVPEPATIGVLAMGGLVALLRKRR